VSKVRGLVPAASLLLLLPETASAHLASTGLGPVYDGVYHLALTPRQVLPMAALALFAGLRGPAHARQVCLILPLAWLLACIAGPGWVGDRSGLICAVALLLTGGLLASAVAVPAAVTAGLAAVLGLVLGCCYDAPPGFGPSAGGLALVMVLLALLASVSLPLRRLQAVIAVRVAGSWTAALGLLLVGWWVHGRGL
jgi:hypothetical protein